MTEVERKPSLAAVKELTETEAGIVSGMFGQQQFVDYEKFEQMCFEDRLSWLKADLLDVNEGRFEEEIQAIATQGELRAFVERPEVQVSHNAMTVAITGGSLYRIDGVKANPGARITLNWAAQGSGVGQMYFYVGEDGKLHVSSECMGRHYVRSVLMRLADELVID